MKRFITTIAFIGIFTNIANASTMDIMMGAGTVGGLVQRAVITKNAVNNSNRATDAIIRNIDAQTENIKKDNKIQVIRQPDGTAKVYQNGVEITTNANPNSKEYQMGLKMAESMSNYFERKDAQAKLKGIKAIAKIENDTKTLEIIKKYKKAGAIITLQKLEEQKLNKTNKEVK